MLRHRPFVVLRRLNATCRWPTAEPAHARQCSNTIRHYSRSIAACYKNTEKWAYVLQADLYNKLSQSKVINDAALRSGIAKGAINAAWDAIGEVVKRVTSTDDGEVEDPEDDGGGDTPNGGGQNSSTSEATNGSSAGSNNGGNSGGTTGGGSGDMN